MTVRLPLVCCAVLTVVLALPPVSAYAATATPEGDESAANDQVSLFDAVDQGVLEMKFIAKSDRRARVILSNLTDRELNLQLPEAFAGVPVLAQFGGGGGGGLGGGGGGLGGGGGGGQGVGGGLGGGGGGGLGGGGGQFSIPPEKTSKIDVAVLCLDHGKKDPSSSKPYEMVPVNEYVEKPAVTELLKAFGRGELNHAAAQAAVWALNNNMSWAELAAKQTGTARDFNRQPYFSRAELEVAFAYANEAVRRAELAERASAAEPSMADEPETTSPGHEDDDHGDEEDHEDDDDHEELDASDSEAAEASVAGE